MARDSQRWTLARLIDFEAALGSWEGEPVPRLRAESRPDGMALWLGKVGASGLGGRWMASLGLAGTLLAVAAAAAGAGAVWGTLDRELGGVHVIWFLAVALGLPWLVFGIGVIGWLGRGRVIASGLVSRAVEGLSKRFAGKKAQRAIDKIRASSELSKALGWRLARVSQWAAAAFHGGALAGLGAMVMVKQVGFFWETTTQAAMEGLLAQTVAVLSAPWVAFFPQAVPDVAGSRRGPEWLGGGEDWWPFLILAVLVWGILPRLLFVLFAFVKERKALKSLAFQAPHHRKLWRAMTVVTRGDEPTGPVDGALVVSLDGAEAPKAALRPFMLQVLRMNPIGWERLGVLDESDEAAAREALARATAGVVLLAEGWSLAPRSVGRALDEVRARAGERRVVLLVGNPTAAGGMQGATPEERAQWERFMDDRKGSEVELVFFES